MTHPLQDFKFCPICGNNRFNPLTPFAKKCGNCGFEFYKNPSIGAVAVIINDKNEIMAVRRAKNPAKGMLGFPGGFVDIGETIEQAIIREAKEETNIDIEVCKYLFSISGSYIYQNIDAYPLDFVFECKIKNMDNIKPQESEVAEIMFLPRERLNPEDFGLPANKEAVKILLTQYFQDNK